MNYEEKEKIIMPELRHLSDENLIIYAREENKSAFALIIDRYYDKIWRYVYRLINNANEADDIVQQTFINAYSNIYSFNPKRKFSSWLYRIAHNVAVNYLKKKKASISIDQNEYVLKKLFYDNNILDEISKKEEYKNLRNLINNLPERYKSVIVLRFLEDKSYSEISDILRVPKNTVGTFIYRAEKILRKKLNEKQRNYN